MTDIIYPKEEEREMDDLMDDDSAEEDTLSDKTLED